METKNLIENYKKQKKQLMENLRAGFSDALKSVFEKYPTLGSFSFTAYTPYFNDGDECTYGVNTYPELYDIYGDEFRYKYDDEFYKSFIEPASNEIECILEMFPNEFYLDVFGDHVEIKVYRDKVEVTTYNHD